MFYEEDLVDGKCWKCGESRDLRKMCELDVVECGHIDNQFLLKFCPACGEPVCPTCNSHYTHFQVSRVTGYLSDVKSWNEAKQAELKDRVHYNVLTGELE